MYRRIVRDADRLARDADEIVIELVVAVQVFVNGDSIGSGQEIGINSEDASCIRRDTEENPAVALYLAHQEIRRARRR